VDLIAGLPGQTSDSWDRSLDCLAQLEVPHASVYIFEIDEDSRLGHEALIGGWRYSADFLPGDSAVADFYNRAVERLAGTGLRRYEISNFARPGFESAHNLKYWCLQPYVGFGLDAHSFDGEFRWSNPDELPDYLKLFESGWPTRDRAPADIDQEHFFIGLRLMNGIRVSEGEMTRFADLIRKWTGARMLVAENDSLRLADDAVLFSNEIFQDFVYA
jgi:oxygen-independent coproporphyrinogen-3 oxidase